MKKKLPDPQNETVREKQDRIWRERMLAKEKYEDSRYEWSTGRIRPVIEDEN